MEECSPPAPPAQGKTDLMGQYRTEIYETDQKAVQAPVELNDSFNDLVGYLSQNAKTDLLKVRAILCWLSKQNFVLAREKEQDESTPKGFLNLIARKEKSLSQLFDILCRKVGVPCVVLSGYNKGCGGIQPKSPTVNNSWLAVYVEKQWGVVEPMLALRAIKVERPRCLKIETTGKAIHER
ncbi:hypothetical protein V1264_002252 [Littorina saxatilis]|uniref:Transglutaminase-like domain-containing protein n=2 Tax=Littorina saxatilis TaxID=31220 RepID=A0AAN9C3K4_9CAEN